MSVSSKIQLLINNKYIEFEIPNTCPHCHFGNTPNVVKYGDLKPNLESHFPLLMQCSNCKKYFALSYDIEFTGNYNDTAIMHLSPYEYKPSINYDLPENLDVVSPSFKEIYTQSSYAEGANLNQIAGVGYRKSIEFLVKDYLIYLLNHNDFPEKVTINNKEVNPTEEIIKNTTLSPVIGIIPSSKIRRLALASTWLGNDETHYTRKYEDKDINSMKIFLNSLAHQVSSDVSSYEALEMIEEKSSRGSK